jgi:hypothetical protein
VKTGTVFAVGCLGLPVLLIGGCAGKMYVDRALYELPGEVLSSPDPPQRTLASTMEVAETLDRYVQPRFEILRDKNFGAFRIVYRRHAGIVQLKVDTPQERALIADVNATKRDFAISLLRCASNPTRRVSPGEVDLRLLYYNRQQVASDHGWRYSGERQKELKAKFDSEAVEQRARAVLDTPGRPGVSSPGKQMGSPDASGACLQACMSRLP